MQLEPERLQRLRDALRERDWHDVTTEELAAAAGLSRMTLHRRGIGKDDVLAQLAALLEREHREAVFPALADDGPAPARVRTALEGICDVNERYLGLIDALDRQLAAEVFHDPGEGPVLTRATFTDGLRRILDDGVADGSLRVDDTTAAATLLFNATGHTYRHMRSGHRWPAAQARERLVALLLDGIVA